MQEMAVMRRAKECRKEVGCGQGHRNKGGGDTLIHNYMFYITDIQTL